MEPVSSQGGDVRKVDHCGMILQTVPRVPMAGIKRRWGGKIVGLQESSPEVTSSGVLSPPPHYHSATPDTVIRNTDDLQIWDLDLHPTIQNQNHDVITTANTIMSIGQTNLSTSIINQGTNNYAFLTGKLLK